MGDLTNFLNICSVRLDIPTREKLDSAKPSTHPPRIMLLHGSLRNTSCSRFLAYEAERILQPFSG